MTSLLTNQIIIVMKSISAFEHLKTERQLFYCYNSSPNLYMILFFYSF